MVSSKYLKVTSTSCQDMVRLLDVLDGVEVTLARLAGLPSIVEYTCNGVDYTFDLLGGLLFLWRLSIAFFWWCLCFPRSSTLSLLLSAS